MNRDKLSFDFIQAIGSSLLLWLLIFLWGEAPSRGFIGLACMVLLGVSMLASIVVAITGFTSVQYQPTRQYLSFFIGLLAIYPASIFFNWRWNNWYEFLFAIATLIIVAKPFSMLLENKKFQRCFEALLITILCINSFRVITLL